MRGGAVLRANSLSSWTDTQAMADEPNNSSAANANPGQSASGAASGASGSSTTPASQNSNASSSNNVGDSFIKGPAADDKGAAAATSAAAARPDWLPETLWDKDKGAKVEDIKALFADADAARARAAGVPKAPGEYKAELPKIDGLPEGLQIDVNDPRFKAAAEFAHAAGLSQKDFSAMLGFEAQRLMAQQRAIADAIKARDEALGPNKAARIDALTTFFKTIAPNEKVTFELGKTLFTTGVIEAWEGVQRALGNQGVTSLTRARGNGAAPAGKIEGYDKMTFVEKLQAGGHL